MHKNKFDILNGFIKNAEFEKIFSIFEVFLRSEPSLYIERVISDIFIGLNNIFKNILSEGTYTMLGFYLALIDEPGDKEKFTEIYNTYNALMFKVAMSVMHNEALANETVQDCLFKISMTIKDFPAVRTKRAKAFIVIMVRNKAVDNLKLEHIDITEPINESEIISNDIVSEILSDMGYKHIVEEILRLDIIYRDILALRLIYEYSIEEICSWLDISENTAKSRLYRGRKILKERLEGIYSEQ